MENKLAKIKNSFWSFFIRKNAVAWLTAFAIILMGSLAYSSLPREANPEINIPIATIATALPGANPEDVEQLITKPIEKEVSGISGITSITSNSNLSTSIIAVEFEASVDLDKATQDIKDRVDLVKGDLPDDATDPVVTKIEANDLPIITFSVIGDRPLHELTKIAEDIQEELEGISGVSRVDLLGGQTRQISVEINRKAAEDLGLSIQDISNLIKFADFNVPVGVISSDKLNYSVRIDNQITSAKQIREIPLLQAPGNQADQVYLGDIATVIDTFSEKSTITKLSINGEQSLETVSLRVFKAKGRNSLEIVDKSKEKMEEITANGVLPSDIRAEVSNDNSIFIRRDLGVLTTNGIQTTILIIIILFLALGLKEGIIAGLSIPLTFLITFIIMQVTGMTINGLTLFSLVIALGLMVDTAIVIMEGIYENMAKGKTSTEAALISLETYKWPLIAGTFTTISAFVPMLLVGGLVGEFLRALPITISAALASSLFVSLFIVPSITARLVKSTPEKPKTSILEPVFKYIGRFFQGFIKKLLSRRLYRFFTIIISILLLAASMMLPISGTLKAELFPTTDLDFFIINIETPNGLILEETKKAVAEVEEVLYQLPEADNFLSIIGSSQAQAQTDLVEIGGSSSSNLANITVNLKAPDLRERRSYEIAADLREELKTITSADITVQELSEGPPTEAPVTIRITGDNLNTLKTISRDVEDLLIETPGTQNIRSTLSPGLNEFKFNLDREALNFYGLSGIQVASTIRDSIQGVKATTLSVDEDDVNVIVKYDFEKLDANTKVSVRDIQDIKVATRDGRAVELGQLGKYDLGESLSVIEREDETRIVKVRSDLDKDISPVEVVAQVQAALVDYKVPEGHEISFGGDTEEIQESFQDLFQTMFVAVILIAFTLVLMFNSFKQPFIILLTLPLALIGVFPGLLLVGLNLSFPAFLGVVALSGIVVNDAIVLIDRINQNRANKHPFVESIAEASIARLQPIIMTSITTIIGILPLALTNEFWSGLGFSLIFGLAFATVLTLVVIPVLYYIFESRKAKKLGQY